MNPSRSPAANALSPVSKRLIASCSGSLPASRRSPLPFPAKSAVARSPSPTNLSKHSRGSQPNTRATQFLLAAQKRSRCMERRRPLSGTTGTQLQLFRRRLLQTRFQHASWKNAREQHSKVSGVLFSEFRSLSACSVKTAWRDRGDGAGFHAMRKTRVVRDYFRARTARLGVVDHLLSRVAAEHLSRAHVKEESGRAALADVGRDIQVVAKLVTQDVHVAKASLHCERR